MKSGISALFALCLLCTQPLADNRSDQLNPNNDAYWQSRGYDDRPDNWSSGYNDYHSRNNRSNQLNPNNDAYWQSRGYTERPQDAGSDNFVADQTHANNDDVQVSDTDRHNVYERNDAIEPAKHIRGDTPGPGATNEKTGNAKWMINCPVDEAAYGNCIRYREHALLKQYPDLLSKNGKTLTIHSRKKNVVFEGFGSDINYFAVGYIPEIRLVLVLASLWSGEGFAYHLIDARTGSYFTIRGEPEFNRSYTKLVTAHADLIAQYNPNDLSVYSRYGNGWREEYHVTAKIWGADNPVWITDEVIKFRQVSLAQGSWFDTVSNDAFLVYQAGDWVLVDTIHSASR